MSDEASAESALWQRLRTHAYVAVVCDVLDSLGYRHQAMHHRLRPLLPDRERCGFIGRARTIRWMEADYADEDNPYGLEIEAIDALRPSDVVVHSTDFAGTNAPWGELMSTAAQCRGATGCVCDSQIRDCLKIIDLGFPVYYTGIRPLDSMGRGRVMAYDVPVRCGDVLVQPGDTVFADFDGIAVIPRAVLTQVVDRACHKSDQESHSRRELKAGKTLREVYDRYGVL
ncbi:RraA family protein [Fimbriiglobus ruber]|uniref:RraA family protein n=1 Tax=Fimbriiglobus ruber TaxID=1908690 RepID=UPI000B4BA535|nr:RraA family protein [Fimbriiglobus ruber]